MFFCTWLIPGEESYSHARTENIFWSVNATHACTVLRLDARNQRSSISDRDTPQFPCSPGSADRPDAILHTERWGGSSKSTSKIFHVVWASKPGVSRALSNKPDGASARFDWCWSSIGEVASREVVLFWPWTDEAWGTILFFSLHTHACCSTKDVFVPRKMFLCHDASTDASTTSVDQLHVSITTRNKRWRKKVNVGRRSEWCPSTGRDWHRC